MMMLAGTGIGIVAAVGLMAVVLSRPQMTPVYTGLEPAEAGRVVKAVEEMGIPVTAAFDGTAVEVPLSDAPRVRMALAEKGLPSHGSVGYELFDTDKPLGITSFMQRMNRLRAMEGELGRTIETLSGVDTARVHIVLPDREEFSRTAPTPTASIVVRMRGQQPMEKKQALAVRHLVSAAVPNLKASAVTVLDTSGEVLLSEDDGGNTAAIQADSQRASHEARISRAVEQMLNARLGRGNVRVQVAVDIESKREVTRSQNFDPTSQVVRSTQTVQEQDKNVDSNGDPAITAQQNLPQAGVNSQANNNKTTSDTKRQEETINYEISNVAKETTIEPGDIRRISVAVLVNGVTKTAVDGVKNYEARTPEELQRLTELVRSAIGFDEQRGDRVTVDNLEFVDMEQQIPPRSPWDEVAEVLSRNVMTLVQWVILLVLCGLLITVGLRPMIRRVFPAPEPVVSTVEETAAIKGATGQAIPQLAAPVQQVDENGAPIGDPVQIAAQPGETATLSTPLGIEETVDQLIELRTVEGRVRASSIRRLGEIVDAYPDEAIDILRSWLYEEAA